MKKRIFGLLFVASAIWANASANTNTITLEVDSNVYGDINANFDGSVTIKNPKLKVNGKKISLLADRWMSNEDYDHETGLYKPESIPTATGLCQLLDKEIASSFTTPKSVLRSTDNVTLNVDGTLRDYRTETSSVTLETVTCK